MEIATGYFAKSRAYADAGYALVNIAKVAPWFLPKELHLYSLPQLAPTDEILKLKNNPMEYEPMYRAQILSSLNPKVIYQRLWQICDSAKLDKAALLCYESPDKFCHRHLVAEWLENELGTIINEVHIKERHKKF